MPIITISRGTQSGGKRLAETLRERLGFKVIRQEEVVEAATRYGISAEDIMKGLEAPPSFWARLTHRKQRFILATQAILAEMVEDGHAIYEGLAGPFLLDGLRHMVKVRLIAPVDFRVRSAMQALDLSREEAIHYIASVDDRRARLVRHLFGVEEDDPHLYDVVVNLDHMSIRTAAEVVADVVAREEFRDTPHSIQEVADFALQMRVRAELEFNSPFYAEQIEVSANRGIVQLSGQGYEARRSEVAEFVAGIAGVKTVNPEDKGLSTLIDPESPLTGKDLTARDVMLAPDRYPTVHQWVTVREAIVALSASTVRLEEDHFVHPRYILVLDEADRLAGIVSRRELLRGLTPQYRVAQRAEEHIRAMVGFGGGADELIKWTSLFSPSAVKAAGQPVSTVMAEVKGMVAADTPLSEVVTGMIRSRVDLAPVVDDGKVIGIVLMTNIFDIVAEFIMEHGGKAPGTGE